MYPFKNKGSKKTSFSRHLGQRVQLECDGQRIPLPELQGIVVLNIPSFMGGTNFWGGTRGDDIFLAPSFDDRILEVSSPLDLYVNEYLLTLKYSSVTIADEIVML